MKNYPELNVNGAQGKKRSLDLPRAQEKLSVSEMIFSPTKSQTFIRRWGWKWSPKILKEGKWTWENRFSPFPFSRKTVIICTNVRHPKLKFTHLVCCFEHCCVFLPVKSFKLHACSGDGKEGSVILIWRRLLSGELQKGGSRWKPKKQGSPHIEGHGREEKGGPGRAWSPSPWRWCLGPLSGMKTTIHFRPLNSS